jgi:hypothetical protein
MKLLTFFLGFMAFAQAEEWLLQPIERPAIPGETRCLPFFVATTFGGTTERIIFWYQADSLKREMISKSRIAVQVLGESQKPTYEKTSGEEENQAIFRLSPTDYEKSKGCLPPPQKSQ